MFYDRLEAGKLLAEKIRDLNLNPKDLIVLALPRGGVVTGAEIAKELKIPLDIIVTRKIGHPFNPEYAVAAVSQNEMIINPDESPDTEYLKVEAIKQRQEISRREKIFRQGRSPLSIKNKIAILVDDGLATGLTMTAAIEEVKNLGAKKIIITVPIAPKETIQEISQLVDQVICLETPEPFFAIGQFYENFSQVSDQEVIKILAR